MAAPKIPNGATIWQNQAPGHTIYGATEEGDYLLGGTPTPGTGVSYNIQTSFSDTVPFLYIYNPGTNGTSLYLDMIRFIVTVAPASTTSAQYALVLDTVARALGTNNTTAATLNNPNGNTPLSSAATLNYQSSATASAIAASSSAKKVVGRGNIGGLTIVGDEMTLAFGQTYTGTPGGTAVEGAGQPGAHIFSTPPVIVPPLASLTMHLWFVGNSATAMSYELLVGMFAR
jgi:hypothetical protein